MVWWSFHVVNLPRYLRQMADTNKVEPTIDRWNLWLVRLQIGWHTQLCFVSWGYKGWISQRNDTIWQTMLAWRTSLTAIMGSTHIQYARFACIYSAPIMTRVACPLNVCCIIYNPQDDSEYKTPSAGSVGLLHYLWVIHEPLHIGFTSLRQTYSAVSNDSCQAVTIDSNGNLPERGWSYVGCSSCCEII